MLSEAFTAALPSIGLNGILEAFTWSEVSSGEDLFGDREWGNASAPATAGKKIRKKKGPRAFWK